MKVELLTYTPNPERLVATAARTCYSKTEPTEIYKTLKDDKIESVVRHISQTRHGTPQQHPYFSFAITGVSLSCIQQMIRYRMCTVDQMSMRYVNVSGDNVIVPPSILKTKNQESLIVSYNGVKDPSPFDVYTKVAEATMNAYIYLVNKGIPKEDARYCLIHGTCSQLIVTMNAFEVKHVLGQRQCLRAQWEIRSVADAIAEEVKKLAPTLFENVGPMCQQLGYCPEGNMSCGKTPTLDVILDEYYTNHPELHKESVNA